MELTSKRTIRELAADLAAGRITSVALTAQMLRAPARSLRSASWLMNCARAAPSFWSFGAKTMWDCRATA